MEIHAITPQREIPEKVRRVIAALRSHFAEPVGRRRHVRSPGKEEGRSGWPDQTKRAARGLPSVDAMPVKTGPASLHVEAAVDGQGLAGDIGTRLAGKKHHGGGDLLRLGQPAHGDVGLDAVEDVGADRLHHGVAV